MIVVFLTVNIDLIIAPYNTGIEGSRVKLVLLGTELCSHELHII